MVILKLRVGGNLFGLKKKPQPNKGVKFAYWTCTLSGDMIKMEMMKLWGFLSFKKMGGTITLRKIKTLTPITSERLKLAENYKYF